MPDNVLGVPFLEERPLNPNENEGTYVYPLEEPTNSRDTNYRTVPRLTEQGRLLMTFLQRHMFRGTGDE